MELAWGLVASGRAVWLKGNHEADLVARLDHCLLRAEELDGGPTAWDQLGDPFPDWDDSCPLT